MIDYYYPLEEIDEFIVYEYNREDQFDEEIDSTKMYYKIYNIDDLNYSVVSLDEQFYIGDSMVLSIENNTIMLDEYHQISSNGLEASKSPRQVFHPSTMNIGSEHVYTLVFDEVDRERYHTVMITEMSKLIEMKNEVATFEQQMVYEQKGVKENDNSKETVRFNVKYKKNVGLISVNSITGSWKTQFRHSRTWEASEWKEKTSANNS